jgi:ATP-dependent Lhr-like helicase
VAVTVVRTRVQSPFAVDLIWRHITEYMYLTDAGTAAGPTGARAYLVAEVAKSATRPCVPEAVVRDFEAKRQRLAPGYAPGSPAEVLELLKERVVVTAAEWTALLAAVERDHGLAPEAIETALAPRLARIEAPAGASPLVAALERAGLVSLAFWGDAALARPWLEGTRAPRAARAVREEIAATRQALFVEWFSFFGPLSLADMAGRLGLPSTALERAGEELERAGKWLAGELVAGRTGPLWCDAASFEILLRLARAARRPHIPALPADRVPYFLATWQGLVGPARDADGLAERLELLSCLPLPAGLWERDILPARCQDYDPAWLEAALAETGLAWFGAGSKRVLFARPEDLDLAGFVPHDGASALFPDARARYDFSALLEVTGLPPSDLAQALWRAAWKGEAACDAVSVLRRGVATDFTPEPAFYAGARQGRRPGHRGPRPTRPDRFAASLPTAGNWYRPRVPPLPADALAREELAVDRARLLLVRYGVVCRDLLGREASVLGWGEVFRALRRLELAGEVVAGEFFAGLSGPQFASPRAVRLLAGGLAGREPWWCAVLDPAWGTGFVATGTGLVPPRRVEGAHAAFAGARPVLVSEAGGARLTIVPGPDDAGLPTALAPLRHLLGRRGAAARRLTVTAINGAPAGDSAYLPVLREFFEVIRERKGLTLYPGRSS